MAEDERQDREDPLEQARGLLAQEIESANADHILDWVRALRSGRYEQTKETLRRGNGYCCLGVACDVWGGGNWGGESDVEVAPDEQVDFWYPSEDDEMPHEFDSIEDCLPNPVQVWLGLMDNPNIILEDGEIVPAIQANDERGLNFNEIADAVERTYLDG